MKILLTGDRGYIGTVLTSELLNKGYEVVGLDSGFFEKNLLKPVNFSHTTITKDIRDTSKEDLEGIDAIIHLAGLSNDPLGEFSGVKRFIYASSQSMYGVSQAPGELDEDTSIKNPVTAYAIAKWDAEKEINLMSSEDFLVTSFRPSTVFGASPRLRCDIVFNNLVACAYTTGKIEIMSDGSPWRPVVHVKDVCAAFISGLEAPAHLVSGRAFNVGIKDGNYQVSDLAEAAQRAVPGSDLIFTGEHGSDSRTYQVSFDRILTELSDYYKPQWNLDKGGEELVDFFKEINFTEDDFRGKSCIRLNQLMYLQENNYINNDLRMVK